jgi:hypothetical protein
MGISYRDQFHFQSPMIVTTAQTPGKIDLRKVGKDIYELLMTPPSAAC